MATTSRRPFELVNPRGTANALLVCDHASNRIPRTLRNLGLETDQLVEHIAWDPGAAEVARGLVARLDAPLLLSGYSRLVIDLNRPLASPESVPEQSDGVPIPGNLGLTRQARAERVAALYDPYHQAIARLLAGRTERRPSCSASTASPPFSAASGAPGPSASPAGMTAGSQTAMLHALRLRGDLLVGDNQPYGVDDVHDYTLPTHGEGRGIPYAMIEIRQDLVRTPADVTAWVERLAEAYQRLEADPPALSRRG